MKLGYPLSGVCILPHGLGRSYGGGRAVHATTRTDQQHHRLRACRAGRNDHEDLDTILSRHETGTTVFWPGVLTRRTVIPGNRAIRAARVES